MIKYVDKGTYVCLRKHHAHNKSRDLGVVAPKIGSDILLCNIYLNELADTDG